ncbi:MAG: TIGR03617 family F420-dependent LLM class oxidoreductase [Dehalococcoidia bacterium]
MKAVMGVGGDLRRVPEQARLAEELGFDAVTTGETQHDSILVMAYAAEHTSRVECCTSVTIAFPRSPMVLAGECWDLQRLSGGRINIGLGSQVKGHIRKRFSSEWSAPAPRMRDYISAMRAIWQSWQDGTPLNFVSESYSHTLMTPFFTPGPNDGPAPKISISAVNPLMAAVAGQVADGLLPHGFATTKYLLDVLIPAVRRGAAKAGRSLDDVEISAGGFMVIAETESEVEQQLQRIRQQISFYGSTRSYHGVFRAHGREELGMRLHEMSLKGQWDEMRCIIPDEVLHEFAMKATYDSLPDVLRRDRWYASKINLNLPTETPAQRERLQWLIGEIHKIPAPSWEAVPA